MNTMLKQKNKLQLMKKMLLVSILSIGVSSSVLAAGQVVNETIDDTSALVGLIGLIALQLVVLSVLASSIKNLTGNVSLWVKKEKNTTNTTKKVFSILLLLCFSFTSFAAGEKTGSNFFVLSDNLFWILVFINTMLFGILMLLLSVFKSIIKVLRNKSEEEVEESLLLKLTDIVPIEKEAEIMMDHEYDGIRELDNNLPPWWVYMFYATIAFGVVYLVHFHVSPIKMFENVAIIGPGVGQEKLYEIEMEEAQVAKEAYMKKLGNLIDETNVEVVTSAADLAKGKEIFKANCTPCHGGAGEGNAIGPNLTDEYWLNGGGVKNIFKTIKYGVPVKGMREWQSQFSPSQIQKIASYIFSLQGSNPANAKAPQGEIWKK